jgi:PDZ domain-containing protein
MRRVFLASAWTAAALAIALFAANGAIRAADEPGSKNKGRRGGDARSNSSGGGRSNSGGGGTPGTGGGNKPAAGGGGGGGTPGTGGGNNPGSGGGETLGTGGGNKPGVGGGNKPGPGSGNKPGTGGGGKLDNKGPGKAGWDSWTKNGWNKNGWNSNLNSQHRNHRHGYWNNGIWIAPWIIAYNRPWVYLQPAQPIVSGQKWLGVTFEPYDGGGAYVTGVYEGSPAQQVGLEVGDVIVSIDGVDATNLGSVVQASDGNALLQVLSGRTGDLVQSRVNLIR